MIRIRKGEPPEELVRLQEEARMRGLEPAEAYKLLRPPLKREVLQRLRRNRGIFAPTVCVAFRMSVVCRRAYRDALLSITCHGGRLGGEMSVKVLTMAICWLSVRETEAEGMKEGVEI